VLTPAFNSGKYIERAICSATDQNIASFEHIIVDGGSTDDTCTILNKYKHLKWISEPDMGQSDAMNKAFNLSTGDLIVYLNADDEFAPDAFKEILNTFKNSPDTDMVVGNLLFSYPLGKLIRVPSAKYIDIIQYWRNLFPNNPVSYFYKRKIQEDIGKFPIDEHMAMDMWFLLKVYKNYKITKLDKVLGTFHSDGTNKTALTDSGKNLHQVVKTHLKQKDPLLLLFFYYKLAIGRLRK
jgi:glycosyltransferase involved in cell wall biosynthesis